MKKLMMIAAMMLMSVGAFAQEAGEMYIKPMVGATFSTITDFDNSKFKFGLIGGAEFGYNVSDAFAVTAGALYSMQGAGAKDSDTRTDASTTLSYINIPILANYYIIPGLAVKAGFQPGFLVSAKSKYKANGHDHEITGTDGYKKVDISIPLGVSYEFSDFVIDARYNLGLTKIFDIDAGSSKNSVIMLTVGYKIPL
jgi:hypothetical protein